MDEENKQRLAAKAAWRKAYYNDPNHPERRERKRFMSRECVRRKKENGDNDVGVWDSPDRQSEAQLEKLASLMAGRIYG